MPPERVFLHVGAPKTGTTYLQALLAANRAALKSDGILYPKSIGDAHHTAAWDLRDTPAQRTDARGIEGAWRKLVDKANSWDGEAVVVSSELFVYCNKRQIGAALSAFTGEVHIIYTTRDLIRQVPAVWQERVKNQQTVTYREFVRSVMEAQAAGDHAFWRAQDAAAVGQRWSRGLDPSRVSIVTAPPPGGPPSVLWNRFISVLGRHGDSYRSEMTDATNPSLGMLQTELLRRYNVRRGSELSWPIYRRTIRTELNKSFAEAISDPRKLMLAAPEREFFGAAARDITQRVRDAGYPVVGDLSELLPSADEPPVRDGGAWVESADFTESELLDAALDVLHVVLTRQQQQRKGSREQRQSLADGLGRSLGADEPPGPAPGAAQP